MTADRTVSPESCGSHKDLWLRTGISIKPKRPPGYCNPILVVDNEKSIRMFVCSNLNARGYCTFEATNLAEAFHILAMYPSCVIILEIHTCRPDWRNALHALEQHPAFGKTVLIIFTTTEISLAELQQLNANVAGMLKKPAHTDALVEMVKQVVDRFGSETTRCPWLVDTDVSSSL